MATCDGAALPGATVTAEAAGSNCAAGGLKVQVGSGAASYVCNGATGQAGTSATARRSCAGALGDLKGRSSARI